MTRMLVGEMEAGDRLLTSVTSAIKIIDKGGGLGDWQAKGAAREALDLAESGELFARLHKEDREDLVASLARAAYNRPGRSESQRGNEVHAALEFFAREGEFNEAMDDDELRPYLEQFHKWWQLHRPVIEWVELPVVNELFGYAGTLDAVMLINNDRVLVDYKSMSRSFDRNGNRTKPYPEVALQVNGLAFSKKYADFPIRVIEKRGQRGYLLNDEERQQLKPGPEHKDSKLALKGAAVIHVTPDYCTAYKIEISAHYYGKFLNALELCDWRKTANAAIGEEIEAEIW